MSVWWLYVVRCSDGSLYTGVSTDVGRRLTEHNHSRRGAKYTASRRPVTLVIQWQMLDRSLALRAEYAFKALPKSAKETCVSEQFSATGILKLLKMETDT